MIRTAPPLTADRASTGGISLVDFDNDGDADLYVTNGYDVTAPEPSPQPNVFYENRAGRFETLQIDGLSDLTGFSSGSTWADFNNDGLLDVFIANQRDQPNVWLLQGINTAGVRHFAPPPAALPAQHLGWSYSAAAADADNDGFVDVYVSNGGLSHSGPNFLYRNVNGQRLEPIVGQGIVMDDQASGGASWADYDNDGDQDIVVASRSSIDPANAKLALYRNDGEFRFTRVDAAISEDPMMPMAVAWGDVDNDGDLDLYVANLVGLANRLYRNNDDGTFTMHDAGRATTDPGYSYTAAFGDLDNDGDLDLVVGNWGAASQIYLNNGAGSFSSPDDAVFRRSIHHASSLALADTDSDGDLDIVIGNWPNTPGAGREENVWIENRYARGNWLRVTLTGSASNRAALGARLEIRYRSDNDIRLQIREVNAHSGWRSQGELTQHFGLGSASAIDELRVHWPSGAVQILSDPSINRSVSLTEPGG